MNIYKSTRAMPYVYMCVHKNTGKFYIGYRSKNVKLNKTSDIDFPTYKTSSKIVRTNFDNFNWIVLAEFFTENAAYDYEQYLINEHWGDPLLINRTCHYGKKRFRVKSHSAETKQKIADAQKGRPGRKQSEETKQKISKASKGRIRSLEECKNISKGKTGKPRAPMTEEAKKKISYFQRGRAKGPMKEETKRKLSESMKGSVPPNKGKPMSDETKQKISETKRFKALIK